MSYPSRCQHIKINGTQCGSPAMRTKRFCYFHHAWHTVGHSGLKLTPDAQPDLPGFHIPLLEDANSVQITLMQIMRLIATKQIDAKSAALMLYALQTAAANVRNLTFEPRYIHQVVLSADNLSKSRLGRSDVWTDADCCNEVEEETVEA
jgi:hypothetical protein